MATEATILLAILTGGLVGLGYFAAHKLLDHDPREPPPVPSWIPIIGHVVALARSPFDYFVHASEQTRDSIFSVPLPARKMYVVRDPDLIPTIQKQHRVLAFPAVMAEFMAVACGTSKETQGIQAKNVNGDEGDHGLSMEMRAAMHEALKPGPHLDGMSRDMIQEVAKALDALQPGRGDATRIAVYGWVRDVLTTASTRSVYGPMNPYDDKATAEAFWEFNSGLMSLRGGALPSTAARKAITARTKAANAFEDYHRRGGTDGAGALAKLSYQVRVKNGVPFEDRARLELGTSLSMLMNTVPAAFWTLFFVLSHPGLLNEVRGEIDACVETDHDAKTKILDLTALKSSCPLLLSTYQETLRHRTLGIVVREVMEDTYLDRWLLKKGATLTIPVQLVHQNTALWGRDAAEFDPRRFLAENRLKRAKDVFFRAFGGGKTLCPGRHFATNEVLALVATTVARLDMRPAGNGRRWEMPKTSDTLAGFPVPDADIEVEVSVRKGMEGVKWEVRLGGSGDKIVSLVAEDQEAE